MKRGFTLVELLVTLAVMAILLTLAAPAFSEFLSNQRLTTQTTQIASAIASARSEAVTRAKTLTLCASADQSNCAGSDWEAGWIMFVDEDGDGAVDGGSDEILLVQQALGGNTTVRTNDFDNAGWIQYQPTAMLSDSDSDGNTDGNFVICDERGAEFAHAVTINNVGRHAIAVDTDGNGIVNGVDLDNDGALDDVSCP